MLAYRIFPGHPQAQGAFGFHLTQGLSQLGRRRIAIRVVHHVHPETGAEQGEGHQQQGQALVPAALHQEEALGRRREDQHGDGRHHEDQHPVGEIDVDQQQIRVEDEQERQRRGTQAVVEGGDPCLDGVALGDGGRRKRRQPHRRRHVRHDAEVEHEQMDGDEGHYQAVLLTEGHHHRGQQAGDHYVVGGGRQPHAEDEAQQGGQHQHQQQVAHGEHLHQIREHQAHPGLGDGTHYDAGGGGGDADADHVAGTGDQPLPQVHHAIAEGAVVMLAIGAQPVEQRPLGEQYHHQHDGAPEGGQSGREALYHQAPHQHHHGQQEVQTGEQHRAGLGQLGQRLVRIFRRQRLVAGGDLEQTHIDQDQQQTNPLQGIVTQGGLEPAQAVVDRERQAADEEGAEGEAGQAAQPGSGLMATDGLHAEFQRLQMDYVEQGYVGDGRRQEGVLDDLHIGDAHILHHQEGRGPHHGRHDLAVDRGGHLDRPRLLRTETDLLHHGDGEGTRGDHVGDGGTGDEAGQAGGHHGRLGGTATQVTQHAEGELDEVVTGAGPFQQGAEQHEQEHETGGDPEGDAKHPFGGDPLMVGQGGEADPAMGQQTRHPGAGQAVYQEDQGDHGQGRAQGAAGGFQQQRNADAGGDQVGGGEVAGALGQVLIHDEQVGGGAGGDQAENYVGDRHPVPGRAAKGRKHQIRQQQGEGEVNGPGLGVIEDAKTDQKRQRGGNPQLEQRPAEGQYRDDPAHGADGQASPHVLCDEFFCRECFVLHRVNFCQGLQQEQHSPARWETRR